MTGSLLIFKLLGIKMFSPISGAHFNPSVSLVFFIRKEIDLKTLIKFIFIHMKRRVPRIRRHIQRRPKCISVKDTESLYNIISIFIKIWRETYMAT